MQELYNKYLTCTGVSIDSRSVSEGDLFFGLSGDNLNGGQYAQAALQNGARYAVVDQEAFAHTPGTILVKDALQTLQELGQKHRDQFAGTVLGITGSNGKTTTKELIHKVLATKCKVQATRGNLNNEIGVPLTILSWSADTEIAIVEMGANHVGDIALLTQIAKPTHGLITNIGYAHTEGFGGIEGVLRGKSELFDYIKKSGGVPFINQSDERLKPMIGRFPNAVVYPEDSISITQSQPYVCVQLDNRKIKTHLTGSYNFTNIAAAVAVGHFFEISDEDIAAAISSYEPDNLRSQILKKGKNTIILDAYNANPNSMYGAIENLAAFEGKRIAILGDMNELEDSAKAHSALGNRLKRLALDEVILIGEKIQPAHEVCPEARYFSSLEEAKKAFSLEDFENAVILLKASRSVQLEKLLDL